MLVGAVAANHLDRTAVLLYTDDVEVAPRRPPVLLGRLLDLDFEVHRGPPGRRRVLAAAPGGRSARHAVRPATHPFTAQRVFEGRVVHRDRAELADTLVGTDEDDAVEVALAATRFADLLRRRADEPRLLRTEARWLQRFVRSHVLTTGADRGGRRRSAARARLDRRHP